MSEIIKTFVKCKGCDGKGWVEVHYARPVPAPKVIPDIPSPRQEDWKKWTPDTFPPYTITTGGTIGSITYTGSTTEWNCDLCGKKIKAGDYHSCPKANAQYAYTVNATGGTNWVNSSSLTKQYLGS